MTGEHTAYCAFILRMWAEAGADEAEVAGWRFSPEPIAAGDEPRRERRGFASAEELLAYLQAEMSVHPPAG